MGKIATYNYINKTFNLGNKDNNCPTRNRIENLGLGVTGNYDNNQLVSQQNIYQKEFTFTIITEYDSIDWYEIFTSDTSESEIKNNMGANFPYTEPIKFTEDNPLKYDSLDRVVGGSSWYIGRNCEIGESYKVYIHKSEVGLIFLNSFTYGLYNITVAYDGYIPPYDGLLDPVLND